MRKILMQYEHAGEWFPIWDTEERDIETAWAEIDNKPTEGGYISFQDDVAAEMMIVNGGFQNV